MTQPAASPTAVVGAAVRLATAPGATIPTFLAGLALAEAPGAPREELVASKPELTETDRENLATLADTVDALELPTARRELSPAESAALDGTVIKVKKVASLLKKVQDALKISLFNDEDVRSERTGAVGPDTPRDNNGFYLVPGGGEGWKRAVTNPSYGAEAGALEALVAEGLISREDYLAMTVQTRVVDDRKFLRWVAKNPEKLAAVRRAVRQTRAGSVSLRLS